MKPTRVKLDRARDRTLPYPRKPMSKTVWIIGYTFNHRDREPTTIAVRSSRELAERYVQNILRAPYNIERSPNETTWAPLESTRPDRWSAREFEIDDERD